MQGCTNRGDQVAVATKFCTVVHNICGSRYKSPFLHQNFEVAPRFLENLCTPGFKNLERKTKQLQRISSSNSEQDYPVQYMIKFKLDTGNVFIEDSYNVNSPNILTMQLGHELSD